MSQLVETTTWSDYAHVGVFVGNGQVVDADYNTNEVLLLTLQQSIRPESIDAEFVDVYRHRDIGNRGSAIASDARRLVGRSYDSWGAFSSQIPFLRREDPSAVARLFCSELACHVYEKNGVPLIEARHCSSIDPDAVAEAQTTQLLGRIVGPTRD